LPQKSSRNVLAVLLRFRTATLTTSQERIHDYLKNDVVMTISVSKPFAINIGEKGLVSKAYVVEGIQQSIPPGGQTFGNMAASHDTRGHVAVTEYKTRTNCTDRIIIFFIDEKNDDGTTRSDNRFVDSSEPFSSEQTAIRKSYHDSIACAYRIVASTTCLSGNEGENCMPMWLLKRISSHDYCLQQIGFKPPELSENASEEVLLSLYDINSPLAQARLTQLFQNTIVPTQEFSIHHKCKWSLRDQCEADHLSSMLSLGESSTMDATTESSKELGGLNDLVITVRRTSQSVANIPISYEIIDKKDAITEQKNNSTKENINSKCSSSSFRAANTATSHDFCFIQPDNLNLLTEYHALVFAQVKRGIMNVSDLAICTRKVASCKEGVRGMRCRHCGDEKGSNFPKSAKNIQPVLLQLHEHLLKCPCCPDYIKRALKMTKAKHKYQAVDKPKLWDRIQKGTIDGGGEALAVHLNRIVQECAPNARAGSKYYLGTNAVGGNVAISAPNVVSCDEDELPKSQDMAESPLPLGARSDDHEGSATCIDDTFSLGFTPRQGIDADDDFGEALSLLQQEPTPCSKFISEPAESVNITPQPIRRVPRGKNQIRSSRKEPNNNGSAKLFGSEKEAQWRTTDKRKRKTETHDNALTRKLTMNDDILLIRGILRYGKKWKTIRDNEPRLHHILHSALKDRTRSKRFQAKLLKAEADPTILDRPHELCEGAHHVQGRSDDASSNGDYGYGSEASYASNTVTVTMPPLYSSTDRKNYLRQAVSEFHLPLEVALDPLFLLGDT